jgi:hypothetical protein
MKEGPTGSPASAKRVTDTFRRVNDAGARLARQEYRKLRRELQGAEVVARRRAAELFDDVQQRVAAYAAERNGPRQESQESQESQEYPATAMTTDRMADTLRRIMTGTDWSAVNDRAGKHVSTVAAKVRELMGGVDWEKAEPVARKAAIILAVGLATGVVVLAGDDAVTTAASVLSGDPSAADAVFRTATGTVSPDGDIGALLAKRFVESSVLQNVSQLAFDSHIGVLRSFGS